MSSTKQPQLRRQFSLQPQRPTPQQRIKTILDSDSLGTDEKELIVNHLHSKVQYVTDIYQQLKDILQKPEPPNTPLPAGAKLILLNDRLAEIRKSEYFGIYGYTEKNVSIKLENEDVFANDLVVQCNELLERLLTYETAAIQRTRVTGIEKDDRGDMKINVE